MGVRTVVRYLTPEQDSLLQRMMEREQRRVQNPGKKRHRELHGRSPDTILVKLPDDGIDARSGTDVSFANCDLYTIDGSDDLVVATSAELVKVYNPYPVKWYGHESADIYITARREKGGKFLCEKPPYEVKVVADEEIAADDTGNCSVWIGGEDSTETLLVYLNWMHGEESILEGVEALAKYFEDEAKWCFINAECA